MIWWNRHSTAAARVGIELLPDGLALAHCTSAGGEAVITEIAMLPCKVDQRQEVLADFVSQHSFRNLSCNLVLSPGDYQLLLVEAPPVPEEEMSAALRWRLKDLINMPLEAAAIDHFDLPSDATRSGKRMIFVVATELEKVRQSVDLVANSGLRPSVVDIAELALRNVSLLLPAQEVQDRSVALVQVRPGGGSLGLYRGGNLYLSRQFNLSYGGGLLDDLPGDDLLLEVQRSLDYAERQMGQAPPAAVYLCGENVSHDKLTDAMKSGLAMPVRLLALDELPQIQVPDQGYLQSCVGAIGAALRHEDWS